MKIPLQSEVEIYIKEKKGWVDEFVRYYADRFYNFYMSNGWKVSGRAAMKDWKAAFNSQWQTLKFKEDVDMFNKLNKPGTNHVLVTAMNKNEPRTEIDRLDAFMARYRENMALVKFDAFGQWYDVMKEKGLLRQFTKGEVENLKSIYQGDKVKCRCACVQITMSGYITSGLKFRDIINIRERLK